MNNYKIGLNAQDQMILERYVKVISSDLHEIAKISILKALQTHSQDQSGAALKTFQEGMEIDMSQNFSELFIIYCENHYRPLESFSCTYRKFREYFSFKRKTLKREKIRDACLIQHMSFCKKKFYKETLAQS